jgi:hypothetical protein
MAKSLLYRLLKVGKMPQNERGLILNNGGYLEEGVPLKQIYKNFKSPGRHYRYKVNLGVGAIGFSKNYLIATTTLKRRLIYLPLDHPHFKNLQIKPLKNKLKISFDAHIFNEQRSGKIEYTFKVDHLEQFAKFFSG